MSWARAVVLLLMMGCLGSACALTAAPVIKAAHASCASTDDLELGTLGVLLTVIVLLKQRGSS